MGGGLWDNIAHKVVLSSALTDSKSFCAFWPNQYIILGRARSHLPPFSTVLATTMNCRSIRIYVHSRSIIKNIQQGISRLTSLALIAFLTFSRLLSTFGWEQRLCLMFGVTKALPQTKPHDWVSSIAVHSLCEDTLRHWKWNVRCGIKETKTRF